MNKSHRVISLALSLATPALAAWLLAGREFSADLFFGAYTLAGLFFLTLTDYTPNRVFAGTPATRKASPGWTRLSLGRSAQPRRACRTKKATA